jgi:electron transfer flavoprotein alpha subunit
MTEILVFCEKDETGFELVSKSKEFAKELGATVSAALLGEGAAGKASDYFSYGADKVYVSEHPALKDFYVGTYAEALRQIAESGDAEFVLLGSTKRGKELAGRVAQKLEAGAVTDANDVRVSDGNLVADRYTYGGNTVASQVVTTPKKVISVMSKTFEAGPQEAKQGEVVNMELDLKDPEVRVVERREKAGEEVNLEEAEMVICVGRGLQKREDLAMIEELAGLLDGEIGCTKTPASDWEWFSEERMVGLSGKKCKPRLYISIGISGQIQHTVGVLDSKIIVTINKDENALIFNITDYGIVGDLYDVVPKLNEKLKSLG